MLGFISKLLGGNKSDKDIKLITPLVAQVNSFFQSYSSLTNDELRGKTLEFRQRIREYLSGIDAQIAAKDQEAEALDEHDTAGRDSIYRQKDQLRKKRDEHIEEVLKEIQPEAFAVVKETARRLKENDTLVATATEHDRTLAPKRPHINIEGDKVIYSKNWIDRRPRQTLRQDRR